MKGIDRVADAVADRSRIVLAVMLVATLVVGAGAGMVEQSTSMDSVAADAEVVEDNDYVRANFSAREGPTTTAMFAVRDPDGNVLSKESLLRSLRFQQRLRANATVNRTLVDERPTTGVANVVARTAIARERRAQSASANGTASRNGTATRNATAGATATRQVPTLEAQIAQLESMNASAVESLVGRVLSSESALPGSEAARRLLPRGYEAGSTTAHARLVVVTQRTDQPIRSGAAVSEEVVDGQVAARAIAKSQSGPETYLAFGRGLMIEQQNASMADSLSILGPLALLFVLAALSVAYRDALDVLLGLVGVVLVLVWTFGVMGWAGVEFNQVMIAVPILLIGLSVDYALHVVMRYRERRAESGEGVRDSMREALGGVGPALVLVTLTTAIGFLANLTSPVPDLRTFGAVTAAGIGATLVVFGVFMPALKAELDDLLEARGFDRERRAFGTTGVVGRVLRGGAGLARRAPLLVLAVALVASAAGGYAAADLDATYSPESFMADDPPAWTEQLPASMQPGEYYLADNREYVYSRFESPDKQVHVLVRGDVTDPRALEGIADAERAAARANATYTRAGGAAPVASPLSAMERVAGRNRTFNATLAAADTDGDGVPDRNVAAVYDALYAAAPNLADQYLHRADGEYVALRVRVPVRGTADTEAVRAQMRDVAGVVETDAGADGRSAAADLSLRASATGQPIVATVIAERLTNTVLEGLVVTLVAILLLLAAVFRLTEGSATLGVVTLVPVLLAVTWLFGTMVLLGIPFTMVTAVVGSIALGLGVDYAIHVSERFGTELDRGRSPAAALERTVVGTGGALLSSAVTTAAGFGVLTFSLLPGLGQFGLVLAVGICYAFLASVVVLPSLLALWARYGAATPASDESVAPATSD